MRGGGVAELVRDKERGVAQAALEKDRKAELVRQRGGGAELVRGGGEDMLR